MDMWLTIVIQQMTLYLLPLLISMTIVGWVEQYITGCEAAAPFYAIAWRGVWLPFLAAIFFTRGVIFSLAHPLTHGLRAAFSRCLAHLLLCLLGLMLYTWSLAHPAPTGLPPIHHWWAKVFMFFNLCMVGIHLLPLPNLLLGEWLMKYANRMRGLQAYAQLLSESRTLFLVTLLAASPLIDLLIGGYLIFPVYESLATFATRF